MPQTRLAKPSDGPVPPAYWHDSAFIAQLHRKYTWALRTTLQDVGGEDLQKQVIAAICDIAVNATIAELRTPPLKPR